LRRRVQDVADEEGMLVATTPIPSVLGSMQTVTERPPRTTAATKVVQRSGSESRSRNIQCSISMRHRVSQRHKRSLTMAGHFPAGRAGMQDKNERRMRSLFAFL
jgi:hypothetical protein